MAGSDLVIRVLTADDASAAAAVEAAVFPDEAWSEAMLAAELASPWSCYLGMWDEGVLVAYGGIKGDQEGDLMTLGVLSRFRGRGMGRRLLRALFAEARRRGMTEMFLEVRASNASARSLYTDEGFETLATIPTYYRNPVEDAVTMRLNLR